MSARRSFPRKIDMASTATRPCQRLPMLLASALRSASSSSSSSASATRPALSLSTAPTVTAAWSRPSALLSTRTPTSTTTPSFACRSPFLFLSTRKYDRKRYLKEKKKLKAQQNQEDITFADAAAVFRKYCLGEDKVVSAYVQVPKIEEGQRPVRGEVALPVQVSDEDKSIILVFAKGAQAEEATRLGAHIVGSEDLIQEILAGKVRFDKVLSTKEMFPQVIKIARVLGPKGLMPSPAKGTVSDDIPTMMSSLRAVTKFEASSDGFIQMEVGKTSWTDDDIFKNMRALVSTVLSSRPSKTDANKYIEAISIAAKHTPGLKLPLKPFKAAV
ncbi:ribosomal protein L1-like protein [Geranomyces variabilis]|nr:ribosomal protein L1-like protein [Geranomyces variabilis]KAJ3136050.1 hypothetical protein HDU90_003452 [Geranomyces variabilis]